MKYGSISSIMLRLVLTLLVLFPAEGFTQQLTMSQWFVGLGSNRRSEQEEKERGCTDQVFLMINDSVLTYSVCEPTEKFIPDPYYSDSMRVWERHTFKRIIPRTLVDSITQILDTLVGKKVFSTDPYIMSGGIYYLVIEGENWCTQFELKNTGHLKYRTVLQFINPYLDEKHQAYLSASGWGTVDIDVYTQIRSCSGDDDGTYGGILGREYDAIRQSKPSEK